MAAGRDYFIEWLLTFTLLRSREGVQSSALARPWTLSQGEGEGWCPMHGWPAKFSATVSACQTSTEGVVAVQDVLAPLPLLDVQVGSGLRAFALRVHNTCDALRTRY